MTAVLDSGALIAIDRRDRRAGAMLRVLQESRVPVRTSAAVVAQVWRNGAQQVNLTRTLTGVAAEHLDGDSGKRIGELLCDSGTSDVIDGHVAVLVSPGDAVLTSDPRDLARLLEVRNVVADLVTV